jgi:hypothetical protein
VGYSDVCWGLTASDDPLVGYLAHEATSSRDNGTIAPTAALSSMPYTPEESIAALKHFYRAHGDRLWGPMGFYDAFNLTEGWFADSYLAIDQGPIICMIENYRTELLWDHFMRNSEITDALEVIGFVPDSVVSVSPQVKAAQAGVFPNPAPNFLIIDLPDGISSIDILNSGGDIVGRIPDVKDKPEVTVQVTHLSSGLYVLRMTDMDGRQFCSKFVVAH